MKKKAILITALSSFMLYSFANDTTELNPDGEKIVTYSKNGVLYRSETYFGNSNTPTLVSDFVHDKIPADAHKSVFHSLQAFIDARKQLDAKYKKISSDSSGKITTLNNNDLTLAYGYYPSVGDFLMGSGNDECYYSNPAIIPGKTLSQSSMRLVSNSADWQALLTHENDMRIFGATDAALLLGNEKSTFTFDYKGSLDNANFSAAAGVATIANTGIPAKENVTTNGTSNIINNKRIFLEKCGSSGVSSFIGGAIIKANITLLNTDHKLDVLLKHELTGSADIVDKIKEVFEGKGKFNYNFTKIKFTFNTEGNVIFDQQHDGASDLQSYITKKIGDSRSYQEKCEQAGRPDVSSCIIFLTNVGNAISSGISYASGSLSNPNNSALNATALTPFPFGINLPGLRDIKVGNAANPYVTSQPARYLDIKGNPLSISDPLTDDSFLVNNARLVRQLKALSERAYLLSKSPYVTKLGANTLMTIAQKFSDDLNSIFVKSQLCFIAEKDSYTGLPSHECSATVSLADGTENKGIYDLPDNVYELYGGSLGIPKEDSWAELLFKNAIALQYEGKYSEIAYGNYTDSNKKNYTIRAANQIEFASLFFNRKLAGDEFFNKKDEKSRGYILIPTSNPELGYSDNNDKNPNQISKLVNGTKLKGLRFWQSYHTNEAITDIQQYKNKDNKLYFVINEPKLLHLADVKEPYEYQNVIFNKINGDNSLSGDSSSVHNNSGVNIDLFGNYSPPTYSGLINNKQLVPVIYKIKGYPRNVASNNNSKYGVECLAGVSLPNLDYPKQNKAPTLASNAVYGHSNKQTYFCGGTDPNSTDTAPRFLYFKLRSNEGSATKVSEAQSDIEVNFQPIPNFFGFRGWPKSN